MPGTAASGRGRYGGRIAGVDVARGLALVGMMSVHIFPAFGSEGDLHPAFQVAAGRAAALFAVLAGVGLALVTGGTNPFTGHRLRVARVAVLVRALLLVLLGLLLGGLDSPPLVILAYYGVLFAAAIPFLALRVRTLAALALGWALLSPLASHLLRATVVDATPVGEPGGRDLLKELVLTGTYPALPWMTYLLAGLAVGRLQLTSTQVAARMALLGGALALVAKLVSGWWVSAVGGAGALAGSAPPGTSAADVARSLDSGFFGTTPTGSAAWLVISAPHSSTTFDLLHTTGTALFVLGVCLLLTHSGPGLLLPLSCAGSMTLTLYTLHVLAVQNGNPLLLDDPLSLWLVHVSVALALATAWRVVVGRGPLEAVMATLARGAARASVRV